jgi:glutaconate CoA-transferase subunit A
VCGRKMIKSDKKHLYGKVAIITGAGQGIGEAIARLFAEQGARVVVNARTETKVNRVVDSIMRDGGAAVSMEQFGLCQQYRKAVESGSIRVEEISESILNARLGAGARNLPFLPTRGGIGSDLIALNPENLKMLEDPFGGHPVLACRALIPDVALIHAHRSDRFGNIQYEPTVLCPDIGIMPKAAKRVIVTAEEIVDSEVLRRHLDRTILPGFMVDAVVEVPFGAHPTSFFPNYGYDSRYHLEWTGVARDNEKATAFLDRYVRTPSTQEEYLDAVGGVALFNRIEKWEEHA